MSLFIIFFIFRERERVREEKTKFNWLPLISRNAEKFDIPAGFLTVHVYLPAWCDLAESINNILPLSPIFIVVRSVFILSISIPSKLQAMLKGKSPSITRHVIWIGWPAKMVESPKPNGIIFGRTKNKNKKKPVYYARKWDKNNFSSMEGWK